ncbi:ABC transporter permease [Pseudactinotalea sp. Z1732]|uniref:ABC transporter permease n=1 Tax=Pseudactinotalea sp. Z1732 TaxID=3413026 RepID=UPI003C7C642C
MLAIAGTELRRFVRDRSNIFFMLIFPMLLVFVLGLQFGGGADQGRVVITGAGGELRQGLAEELERTGTEVDGVAGAEEMRTEVARERAEVGLYIDAEAESDYASGQPGQIEMIAASGAGAPMVQQRVLTALGTLTGPRAEVAALTQAGVPPQEADAALVGAREAVAPVSLTVTDAGGQTNVFAGLGRFDLEAGSMLLLFVFLSTLSSAVTLIQSRRLGVQARVVVSPVSAGAAIGGQVLGRWVIAFVQGGYIMVASMVLFDVDFGNLAAALVLVAVFGAVATGTAMLLGALIDHEGAATGVSVGLGLVLAALGGLMFPLDLFPDTLRTVAHATPHAWGYEAFAELQRHGGGVADIAPQLGVLAAMAAVLIALGAVALRRAVSRAM